MPFDRAEGGPEVCRALGLSDADRAELVVQYLGLADSLARRHAVKGHDVADVTQVARLGLLRAAARYKEDEGEFVSFAIPTILGEIRHYVRDNSWVVRPPRRIQELRMRVNGTRPDLEQSLGREPTLRELAEALDLSVAEVAEAIEAEAALLPHPLGGSDEEEGGPEVGVDDPGFGAAELRAMVDALLREATDWERRLLHLRFVRELSQKQIAGELGVSQMQVSRLLRSLMVRLRAALEEGSPGAAPED